MAALIKRILANSLLVLMLCGLAPATFAADEQPPRSALPDVYKTTSRLYYALEIPMTAANVNALNSHRKLYQDRFLLLDTSTGDSKRFPLMRIGFFNELASARDFHRDTEALFSRQSIVALNPAERRAVAASLEDAGRDSNQRDPAVQNIVLIPLSEQQKQTVAEQRTLLRKAESLYRNKDYDQAAAHYLLLAALADDASAAWSMELAGLCYEKAGHYDAAISQYRQLINSYPQSKIVARVSQRLRGLETAAMDDKLALKTVITSDETEFFTRGVVGQYYRSVRRDVNNSGTEKVLSLLSTDWDIRSSIRRDAHDINVRISGFALNDELDSDNDELEMKYLLIDYQHQTSGIGAVLGRQKDSDSGVYSYFDGLTLSYRVKEDISIAVSAGEPIYRSDIYNDLDYFFYSLHSQWDIGDHWQVGGYVVKQEVNDVTDREAIGLQGRYNSRHLSTYLVLDYDTAFSELNNVLLHANYRINEHFDITALYGKQRSPLLTATNILIGQADLDLDAYLQSRENRDQLLDDALARTSLNQYYSLSLNLELNDNIRWITDFYASTLSDIPSSELLLGLPETGLASDSFDYQSLGTQWVLRNFIRNRDSVTLGLRSTSSDTSDSKQIFLYDRMYFGKAWSLIPKLSLAQIDFSSSNDKQQQLRYSLSLNYRPLHKLEFNLELGNESLSTDKSDTEFDSYYIFLGYRLSF